MGSNTRALLVLIASVLVAPSASATVIDEFLNEPPSPGSALSGVFLVTPSGPIWAFGVGNDKIQDTSISGTALINGLSARRQWISAIISRDEWTDADGDGIGFDFNSIFPLFSTKPSAFDIDTRTVPWQWGSADQVAYYWLSNQTGKPNGGPGAVLQAGVQYNAFNFFADAPLSPFVTWTESAGGFAIQARGETVLTGPGAPDPDPAPEPATTALMLLGLSFAAARRRAHSGHASASTSRKS